MGTGVAVGGAAPTTGAGESDVATNRTLKALGLAIIGAEYVLRWLPRGTHQFHKLVRPDELEKALAPTGMTIIDRTGVAYNPLADRWHLSKDMDVNYMVLAERPGDTAGPDQAG